MKKTIILCLAMLFCTMSAMAYEKPMHNSTNLNIEQARKLRAQKNAEFEKKLKLTDAQKLQAKELRKNGYEKISPIIQNIKTKEEEKLAIRASQQDQKVQREQIAKINNEIKVLQKQASDVRKQNMKDFEAILTTEQKNILKTMKKEGRKKYKSKHPCNRFNQFPNNNKTAI